MRFPIALLTVLACALAGVSSARCQISDDIVKIGVLNDQSGLYDDLGGPGSVVAAPMAVEVPQIGVRSLLMEALGLPQ